MQQRAQQTEKPPQNTALLLLNKSRDPSTSPLSTFFSQGCDSYQALRSKEAALAINILLGNCIQDLTPFLVEELRALPSSADSLPVIQRCFERYRIRKMLGLRLKQVGFLGLAAGLGLVQGAMLLAGTLSYILLIITSHSAESSVLFVMGIGAACASLLLSILIGIHLCTYHSKLLNCIKNLGFEKALLQNTCLTQEDYALIQGVCESETHFISRESGSPF